MQWQACLIYNYRDKIIKINLESTETTISFCSIKIPQQIFIFHCNIITSRYHISNPIFLTQFPSRSPTPNINLPQHESNFTRMYVRSSKPTYLVIKGKVQSFNGADRFFSQHQTSVRAPLTLIKITSNPLIMHTRSARINPISLQPNDDYDALTHFCLTTPLSP